MRQDVVAIGQPTRTARFQGGPQAGLSWRHVATALLLVITLPVFATAGVAAMLLLPVLLVITGVERARRLIAHQHQPVPIRHDR
jgi:hypothetical protein